MTPGGEVCHVSYRASLTELVCRCGPILWTVLWTVYSQRVSQFQRGIHLR